MTWYTASLTCNFNSQDERKKRKGKEEEEEEEEGEEEEEEEEEEKRRGEEEEEWRRRGRGEEEEGPRMEPHWLLSHLDDDMTTHFEKSPVNSPSIEHN